MQEKTLEMLRNEIKNHKELLGTWQAVGDVYNVHRIVVWRIVNDDYEPRKNFLRRKLGLSQIIEKELVRDAKGRFTKIK